MTTRMKLVDIVTAPRRESIEKTWRETEAAPDFGSPLPRGAYVAHVVGGELTASRKNATPGYSMTFKILEGEFAGRMVWHTVWLSEAAIPMAKRDLAKLGVTELEQLESPLPQGIRVELHVVLHKDDDGEERNRIRRFDVLGIDAPPENPFAPAPNLFTAKPDPETTTEPAADFPFGWNAPDAQGAE